MNNLDTQFREASADQLWLGKDAQLRRLKELRVEHGPTGNDELNDRALRMLDVAIVETLVSLRRLEEAYA